MENVHLSELLIKLGVRESRRVIGEYVLTENDVLIVLNLKMG